MPVLTRYRTVTAAGVIAAVLLVLIFGSPWYVDWVQNNTNEDTAGGWWLRLLAWPAWNIDADQSLRSALGGIVRAILVVVFTAVFLILLASTQLSRARGTVSQFFAGWASYVFAGAAAGLLSAWILADPSLLGAYQAAGSGAIYGLFTGWIVGAAALGGRARGGL